MMLKDNTRTSKVGCIGIPHLHGHTKITLTDSKTGEVETYEKDNMVTDAVEKMFAANLFGNINYTELVPVKDLFGGVMCFDNELSTLSITPERGARVVANAGDIAHSTASTKRGNPNGGESGAVANGYKYVWDFATNQGNGTINSLSLCHKSCGNVSVAPDIFVPNIPLLKITSNHTVITAEGTNASRTPHNERYIDLFYLNPSGDWGYHSAGTTINKVETNAIEQKINGILGDTSLISSKTFTIPDFTAGRDSVTYDVENDKIIFVVLYSSSVVKVYSVDYDEEEITTYTFDQGLDVNNTIPSWISGMNASEKNFASSNLYVKSGKYIFVPAHSGGFYRLNLTNVTDIVEVAVNATFQTNLNTHRLGQVNINEGIVMGYNYIISDKVYEIAGFEYGILWSGTLMVSNERMRVARSESADIANIIWYDMPTGGSSGNGNTFYLGVALIYPYVATIQQDFQNPIIKTSEKTMKIEYTITNSN